MATEKKKLPLKKFISPAKVIVSNKGKLVFSSVGSKKTYPATLSNLISKGVVQVTKADIVKIANLAYGKPQTPKAVLRPAGKPCPTCGGTGRV